MFQDIDYLMITVSLLCKNYTHLASCLVPIGDQIGLDQKAVADMLRTETKLFLEEDIVKKYGKVR